MIEIYGVATEHGDVMIMLVVREQKDAHGQRFDVQHSPQTSI